jgi:hypothetical protein
LWEFVVFKVAGMHEKRLETGPSRVRSMIVIHDSVRGQVALIKVVSDE